MKPTQVKVSESEIKDFKKYIVLPVDSLPAKLNHYTEVTQTHILEEGRQMGFLPAIMPK